MVKETYQLSPRTRMELLHSNIWWFDTVELINNGFTSAKNLDLYHKQIQCVDVLDSKQQNFLMWNRAQEKLNLAPTKAGDLDHAHG